MSLAKEIKRDLKGDIKAAMEIRPPGWSVLAVIVISFFAHFLMGDFGKANLLLPIGASIIAFSFIIYIKWNLRQFAWFWAAVAFFVALHALLIVFVPWTTSWVPAAVTATIGSADLIVMLAVIDAIARIVKCFEA